MESRRSLPHSYPEGRFLFLTWHLSGALPPRQFPPPHIESSGRAFAYIDKELDLARTGPLFLRQTKLAELVTASILRGHSRLAHYRLEAFVVMPNHVHLLVLPRIPPPTFLRSLKSFTARMANRTLGATGTAFWQQDSYDHWVRDNAERERIAAYIVRNPVRAGLCQAPEEFRWSSAWYFHRGISWEEACPK